MRSERGYTLFELLIVLALIGIVTGISVPVFMESNKRSALWTGAEQIGATVRSARLKAISQNTAYRVVFNCPSANELRTLVVIGDPAIDDDAGRCGDTYEGDSGTIELPTGVAYDVEDTTSLQVSGRGIFTAIGGAIPSLITVTSGAATRILTVSGTGQITFTDVD
ncbi:MAG TPA: prepilin-type N-terminal cleavage/methylation domain-containing protein [Vicinamibacterales bacterium]|nr:prepilin-type N-terminal cleavage/methylation domain-containing protein [Vicinamibacterales bacterium]